MWYTWSHIQRLSEDLGEDTCLTTCSAPRANNGVKNQLPQVVHLTAMLKMEGITVPSVRSFLDTAVYRHPLPSPFSGFSESLSFLYVPSSDSR